MYVVFDQESPFNPKRLIKTNTILKCLWMMSFKWSNVLWIFIWMFIWVFVWKYTRVWPAFKDIGWLIWNSLILKLKRFNVFFFFKFTGNWKCRKSDGMACQAFHQKCTFGLNFYKIMWVWYGSKTKNNIKALFTQASVCSVYTEYKATYSLFNMKTSTPI